MSATKIWDCATVGAGPAALAAAVYTSREDIQTILIEKGAVGGLAAVTEKVDNYPGFADGISGLELAANLQRQAERFGAHFELDEVQSLQKVDNLFELQLTQTVIRAKSVLIGTGSSWKKLNIAGEAEFYGRGIHNCATCDGAFYRDKKLVVIGGGNSAAQESLFLTKFASSIDLLIRKDAFRASHVLVEEVNQHPKIKVHFQTAPQRFEGENDRMKQVIAEQNGQLVTFPADGVFVFIGLKPVTDFLQGSSVELDSFGFVPTDATFQTNLAGCFCAGDVRSGATMQIASAIGEGASAALAIRHYLDAQQR